MLVDMPNAEYHAHSAISRSFFNSFIDAKTLKLLPLAAVKYKLANPEAPNAAMGFGTLSHTYMLEHHFIEGNLAVFDKFKTRDTAGFKAFEKENPDKICIHINEQEQLEKMYMVFSARKDLMDIVSAGDIEKSVFWTDDWSGIECKARADVILDDCLYDYKTTGSIASPEGFAKASRFFGYHRQAAWYLDGFNKANGNKYKKFRFIVQEKQAPYLIACYEATDDFIETGRKENSDLTRVYATAKETNDWPGYGSEFKQLDLEW